MSFVHLHNHTTYSLLDGACRLNDLAEAAKKFEMPAIAITDHGNMFGAVNFYQTVLKTGIKPIIGLEAYVAPDSRHEKTGGMKGAEPNAYHLILLAKNLDGYRNLMKLSSIGYTEGFYYKPRIDREVIKTCKDGLICLSSCIQGEVPRKIIKEDYEGARQDALFYRELFGDDFYLEIQNHGIAEEEIALKGLRDLSKELDIPLVATNDTHYLQQNHAPAQDALICIQTGKDINDTKRMKFTSDQLYFKTYAEMSSLFPDLPEALSVTLDIAQKCNLVLEFGNFHLPVFSIPESETHIPLDEYLSKRAHEGLYKRYGDPPESIKERLEFELSVIKKMGFPGYFLIVMDFIDYARKNNIPVGPGRGSAAGSIVSYCLGITNVDPIEYGLLFERFLNPDRISMPDIDIDFCYEKREKVIEYVRNKYGSDNVTQIITFGSMNARAVIRDVGRVLNIPYGDVDKIAKLIPAQFGIASQKAIEEAPEFKKACEVDDIHKRLLEYSLVLEGLTRHASTHAAGVVITPGHLTDYVPLFKAPQGEVTTQYDMNAVETIGLLKMDFLGLRTLTVIDQTIQALAEKNIDLNIDAIPMNDSKTFDIFANGETIGIFQFESAGMREYLKKLKPDCIQDLVAMNALYRPGPMRYIDDFIDRKQGRKKIEHPHPWLEEILKETYGIIVYQEQVMQIAGKLAGFSMADADKLRKAMGKKKIDLMNEMRIEFMKGAQNNQIPENKAEEVFAKIDEFAGYGFNKSHAVCYSIVAYQTAYLKAHYPKEFMAANLTSEMGNTDRVVILIDDCKRMGIEIMPPDVNSSFERFVAVEEGIRFGLKAVKNVGAGAIQSIIAGREIAGPFTTLYDFCKKINTAKVNKKVIESLIQAGAMDSLEGHRAQLMAGLANAVTIAQSESVLADMGQTSIFGEENIEQTSLYPELPDVPEWSQTEILKYEKEIAGIYISGHPLLRFQDDITAFSNPVIAHLEDIDSGRNVQVCGMISQTRKLLDKKKRLMAFFNVEDFSGSARLIAFADCFEQYGDLIDNENMVFIAGKIDKKDNSEDYAIIAERIIPLDQVRNEYCKRLILNINTDHLDDNTLTRLKMLVQNNPGHCSVFFNIECNGEKEVLLQSKAYKVFPNINMVKELRNLFGRNNVWIEG